MSTDDKRGRQSPDQAARGGSARYEHSGTGGHQESKKREKKEDRGFVSRQGGDQSQGADEERT